MLAIRADRLFDGVDAVPVERPVVLIESGRIGAVQSGPAPSGAEVVDLGATTLLPGLIDAHVNLAFDASDDPVGHLTSADESQVLSQMRAAARLALSAGITTVRDLGDRDYLSLKLRDELALLAVAGDPLTDPATLTKTAAVFRSGVRVR